MSMSVSEALDTRRAIRAFLPDPLPKGLLADIVRQAGRAPSGGNIQPWFVYGVEGPATDRLRAAVAEDLQGRPRGEPPEFMYYPDGASRYTDRRLKCAEDMFTLVDLAPDDRAGRIAQVMRNYRLFDAPAALFFTIDRHLDRNHWAQLGMLVQSIMLLARDHGLHTCPQEAWTTQRTTLQRFFGIPDEQIVWCGVCVGYADPDAPVNRLRTDRAPLDEFATFVTE